MLTKILYVFERHEIQCTSLKENLYGLFFHCTVLYTWECSNNILLNFPFKKKIMTHVGIVNAYRIYSFAKQFLIFNKWKPIKCRKEITICRLIPALASKPMLKSYLAVPLVEEHYIRNLS